MGRSKAQALDMLSPFYGHLSLFTPAKTYFIQIYEGKQWAHETYDPCIQDYKHYDKGAWCNGIPAPPSDEAEDT